MNKIYISVEINGLIIERINTCYGLWNIKNAMEVLRIHVNTNHITKEEYNLAINLLNPIEGDVINE